MARILIVDDDIVALKIVTSIADEMGHSCVTCQNGEEALNLLDQGEQIDLIISDLIMPKLNGFLFLKRIMQMAEYADKPIIAISADTSVNQVANVVGLGDITFVGKPLRMLALKVAIKNALINSELRNLRTHYLINLKQGDCL